MVDPTLPEVFHQALEQYELATRALVPLVEQMAIETVADVLPGAVTIEVHGEYNEDWLPILRIQRVTDADGVALFDSRIGHGNREVEDTIDTVNTEYLDLLLDLTSDDYMGAGIIHKA
jgi:hypothetical protein